MSETDPIDEAFRIRRAAQAEQVELLRVKQEVSAARRSALENARDRIVLPVLGDIEKAFERNGSPIEESSIISEGDKRAGGERRFQIPGRDAGQMDTLVVAAVAVRTDPAADLFRIITQVAERREQSDGFPLDSIGNDGDTETLLRSWTSQSLQRLVVERLRRRGL